MSEHKDKGKQPPPEAKPDPKAAAAPELPPDKRQSDPKVVKLVKRLGPDGKAEDRPPEPPVAVDGPVPRPVHQNERAPAGLVRFKVSARNFNPRPVRYILARTEAEARQCYVESTGLDFDRARMQAESEAALEQDLRVLRLRAIHSPQLAGEAERLASHLEGLRVVRAVPEAQLVVVRLAD